MKKHLIIALCAALALAFAACGGTAKVHFQAVKQINDGLLVPVDIIATNQDKSKEILAIGPDDWFTSSYRESLSDTEIRHLAIAGGETRYVKFKGPKGTDTFVIFADFQGVVDRDRQQVVFHPSSGGRTIHIELRAAKLYVTDGKKD